jgi:hypothetical protein
MSWSGVCVVCCAGRLCGGVAACLGSGVCVVCCADRLCGGVATCLGSGVCVVSKTETCRSNIYVNFRVKLDLSKFNK